jgi:hypothetical protein
LYGVLEEVKPLGNVSEMISNNITRVGFEVFTVVVLKSIFFWDMTPCSALRHHIPEEDTLQHH